MARASESIDTGQTLGNNGTVRDGKVVVATSSGALINREHHADITFQLSSRQEPVLGATTSQSKSDTAHVFFATHADTAVLHRDVSGQIFLTIKPVVLVIFLGFFISLTLLSMFVQKVRHTHLRKRAPRPTMPTSPAPHFRVRRLTL